MEKELNKLHLDLMSRKEIIKHFSTHYLNDFYNNYSYDKYKLDNTDLHLFAYEKSGFYVVHFMNYLRPIVNGKLNPVKCKINRYKNDGFLSGQIIPVIRIKDPVLMQKILDSSTHYYNGNVISYGRYPYRYVDEELASTLENLFRTSNIILTGRAYEGFECFYKDDYYVREVDRKGNVKWILVKDIKWYVDEKGKKLIATECMDTLKGYINIFTKLSYMEEHIHQETLTKNEYRLFRTRNEEKNNIPFSTCLTLSDKVTDYCYALGRSSKSYMNIAGKVKCGIKAIVEYSYIKDKCELVESNKEYDVVKYGEYPQSLVNKNIYEELEFNYKNNELNKTGKTYTSLHMFESGLNLVYYPEYEYKGEKYIRMDIFNKDAKWIKVEPVLWDVYGDNPVLAHSSSELIFVDDKDPYTGKITEAVSIENIKRYLDKFFSKEIVPSKLEYKITDKKSNNKDNIMRQIILKKKEELEQISKVIENDTRLKKIMEENNLSLSDIELDENGRAYIRGLKI